MKYVRTEDGIYEVDVLQDIDGLVRLKLKTIRYLNPCEIIKQTDTIEELCDCVIYVKVGYENNAETIRDFQKRNRKSFDKDLIVYGAIWTAGEYGEPILKSVAQMNEKGELELL